MNTYRCLEPAAGTGEMLPPLSDAFGTVDASDKFDHGLFPDFESRDFLDIEQDWPPEPYDWIITNPPDNLAKEFCLRALEFSPTRGYAMLVHLEFLSNPAVYSSLFAETPPTDILIFGGEVSFGVNRSDRANNQPRNHCWCVWRKGRTGTQMFWIPPATNQDQHLKT